MERLDADTNNLNDRILNMHAESSTKEATQLSAYEKTETLSVAAKFWNALNANDLETAKSFSTKTSQDSLKIPVGDSNKNQDIHVTFSKSRAEGDRIIIPTIMHTEEGESKWTFPYKPSLSKKTGNGKLMLRRR